MFKDKRSGRVAIVAHCILNQNSRVPGLAERSSIITEIVEFLENNDIGIIQMPCPELAYAGVSRRGQTKELYDNPVFRRNCKKIAEEIVDQIQEYSRCQIKTELIIGVEGSPSCGVTDNLKADSLRNSSKHKKREDTGILIEELRSVLEERNISMPIIGIGYEALPQDLAEMKRLLQD
jgi:predicted secreted protein